MSRSFLIVFIIAAVILIGHDMGLIAQFADRIGVMYLGKLCEVGPTEKLFSQPAHPYTALLLEAIPVPDPAVKPANNVPIGEPPSPLSPPSGCRFRTRCPRADTVCAEVVPPLEEIADGQFAACHHPLLAMSLRCAPSIGRSRRSRSSDEPTIRSSSPLADRCRPTSPWSSTF